MAKVLNQSVQWHITEVCPNRCKHCYIDDMTNMQRRKQELSFEKMITILDNIEEFADKYNVAINHFAITGGDPFEHQDFDKLLKELYGRGKSIQILGIPERVSAENLSLLKKYDVRSYQVSLDGMPKTHDAIRGRESFKKTILALKEIEKFGYIQPHIMYTLHKRNCEELFELIDYLDQEGIYAYFAFDFLVNSDDNDSFFGVLSESDVDNLLCRYRQKRIDLRSRGSKLHLKEKVKLFETFDITDASQKFDKYTYVSGCYCGISSISILPNGDLLPCRRLPIVVGNLLENRYEDIFLDNMLMRKLRRISSYEKCNDCDYAKVCRGCAAVTYAMTGNVFGEFKYCNRKKETSIVLHEPPLNCSREEEFAYVTNNLMRSIISEGIEANMEAIKYEAHRKFVSNL